MKTVSSLVLALAALVGTSGFADPPQAPKDQPPATVSGIVVTAPRADTISGFVNQISAPNSSHRVARWDRSICPGVLGVTEQVGEYINDRLAKTAIQVGLDVGKPGCKPNILIIMAKDGNKVTRELVKRNPNAFAKYGSIDGSGNTRGRKALKEFIEIPAPVRWWHVSQMTGADGTPLAESKELLVHSVSRLKQNVRDDFDHVIIVVDSGKTEGIPFPAFCDYLTMVALAQIDPKADSTRVPSILNIFHERDQGLTPTPALTEWDMTYLKGLYGSDRDALTSEAQKKQITQSIKRDEQKRDAEEKAKKDKK